MLIDMHAERLNSTLSSLLLLALTYLGIGCSTASKAYPGQELPSDQLALFSGFSTSCYGSLMFDRFDEHFSGRRLEAPAGYHRFIVRYRGEPYEPYLQSDIGPPVVCYKDYQFEVADEFLAAQEYSFSVNEDAAEGVELESYIAKREPTHQERQSIRLNKKRLSKKEKCLVTHQFDECFGWRY